MNYSASVSVFESCQLPTRYANTVKLKKKHNFFLSCQIFLTKNKTSLLTRIVDYIATRSLSQTGKTLLPKKLRLTRLKNANRCVVCALNFKTGKKNYFFLKKNFSSFNNNLICFGFFSLSLSSFHFSYKAGQKKWFFSKLRF